MAKKSDQPLAYYRHFIVAAGYALFAFVAAAVIFGQIVPRWHLLQSPYINSVAAAALVSSALLSVIVPLAIAYLAGNASTRGKVRQNHHYNGVMFGLLAFWVSMLAVVLCNLASRALPSLGFYTADIIGFAYVAPVVLTTFAVGLLAYNYHRGHGQQADIVAYRPYQISFFTALGALVVLYPLQQSRVGNLHFANAALAAIILVAATCVTYVCLMNIRATNRQKVMLSAVGATLVAIAVFTVYLAEIIVPYGAMILTMALAAALVWLLFVLITRQSYGIAKQ